MPSRSNFPRLGPDPARPRLRPGRCPADRGLARLARQRHELRPFGGGDVRMAASFHRMAGAWSFRSSSVGRLVPLRRLPGGSRASPRRLGHGTGPSARAFLGGAVASLYAAVRPERVERLWLIEGLGPLSHPSEHAATALAEALAARHRLRERAETPTLPRSRALDHRPRARQLLSPRRRRGSSSERSLERDSEGWRWRSDSRLTVPSPFRLCEETVIALLAAIQCPVALVLADPPSAITWARPTWSGVSPPSVAFACSSFREAITCTWRTRRRSPISSRRASEPQPSKPSRKITVRSPLMRKRCCTVPT